MAATRYSVSKRFSLLAYAQAPKHALILRPRTCCTASMADRPLLRMKQLLDASTCSTHVQALHGMRRLLTCVMRDGGA